MLGVNLPPPSEPTVEERLRGGGDPPEALQPANGRDARAVVQALRPLCSEGERTDAASGADGRGGGGGVSHAPGKESRPVRLVAESSDECAGVFVAGSVAATVGRHQGDACEALEASAGGADAGGSGRAACGGKRRCGTGDQAALGLRVDSLAPPALVSPFGLPDGSLSRACLRRSVACGRSAGLVREGRGHGRRQARGGGSIAVWKCLDSRPNWSNSDRNCCISFQRCFNFDRKCFSSGLNWSNSDLNCCIFFKDAPTRL